MTDKDNDSNEKPTPLPLEDAAAAQGKANNSDESKSTTSSNSWKFPNISQQLPTQDKISEWKYQITSFPKRVSEWRIPEQWQEPLERGVVKAVFGAVAGGAIGLVLFRSGSGWRSACVAVGIGAAMGNTYERINSLPSTSSDPTSITPKSN